MPIFWGTVERFANNYDSYELTTAPPKLPSGGLFSIKNFSLETLFSENQYVRNIWTTTNNDLPLVRYTGCKFKIFASEHIDLIASYDTSLPLRSSMQMYHTMHPGVHILTQNRKIIHKKNSTYKTKPYTTVKIKPPKPLTNKWYFQAQIAKTPLVQLRVSATTLDNYWVSYKSISTTISIYHLNSGVFENLNFKNFPNDGYYCRLSPTTHHKVYLVTFTEEYTPNTTTYQKMIFLGNTTKYTKGNPISSIITGTTITREDFITKYNKTQWGNPFYTDYLTKKSKVYFFSGTLVQVGQNLQSNINAPVPVTEITECQLIHVTRYNPLEDHAQKTSIYFKSNTYTESLDPPGDIDLYSANLPIWILTYGFADFIKRMGRLKNIDTEYSIVFQMKYNTPTVQTFIVVDEDFINGKSPFEKQVNPLDAEQWYPSFQMQAQTINTIAYSGQGSPKIPTLQAVQAKMYYCFYFKWGGNPPPMSTVTDPREQPYFHIPSNIRSTNSLQNPTAAPESYLYSFDQRRDTLTEKALRRIQKDWGLKKDTLSSTERFLPAIQTQQESTSETSSEEETEETSQLLDKLHKQQRKHKQLKQRIMEALGYLQKLE